MNQQKLHFPYPALDQPTMWSRTLGYQYSRPVVIIGDQHGCIDELQQLLSDINKDISKDCYLVSVGDLTDRGPDSIAVLKLWYKIRIKQGRGLSLIGNHDRKLIRYLLGYNINLGAEQQWFTTINSTDRQMILELFDAAPSMFKVIDFTIPTNKRIYLAAHAAADYTNPELSNLETRLCTIGKKSANIAWYGHTTGKQTEEGYPERLHILCPYKDMTAIFGHIVHDKEKCVGYNEPGTTIYIDHGAVFGGYLSAVIIKPGHTWEILSVKSKEYFKSRHESQQKFEKRG